MKLPFPRELFDEETLRHFETARLLARRLARGRARGERRSFSRGMSAEFSEYRPFVSGDDWRAIDWHAYARWRQLILKIFVEEEDLHIHLLLDCSRSMDWGEPSKFDQARRILGGLACVALANLDRVGVVPLGLPWEAGCPPRRGRERLPTILSALAAYSPTAQRGGLEDCAQDWLKTLPRRGLVLLVSDLFGSGVGDALRAFRRLRHAGHDIGVVQVMTKDETSPPAAGEYVLEDCETGRVRRVVMDHAAAAGFQSRAQAFLDDLDSETRRQGIPLLRASNSEPLPSVLASVLAWA